MRAQYAESVRDRKAGSSDKDWELIGSTFHRWVRDNRTRLKLGTEAENLTLVTSHFPFFARAYLAVLDASRTYTKGLEAVFYNAHNEFTWQYTVLLAPLTVGDDPDTVRRKIGATATYLDIWLMRRVVNYIRVGYSTTSYAMYLLCKDIRQKSLPDLVATLVKKLQEDDATFDGSESRGRSGIAGLGLNQFSRRYIYHMLARLTAFTEVGAGRPDLFDKYVDREQKNPWDIEHVWADDPAPYLAQFASEAEFQDARNHIAGLVLLPADVNRSYQDKPYEQKVPHYAKQNMYAASLTAEAYQHQPQFVAFCKGRGLPFRACEAFGRKEQAERRELVLALAKLVWSPDRLQAFLA
ncbi:MAG: DUF1524 domain-containing protein [Gemmataceae bacterium]